MIKDRIAYQLKHNKILRKIYSVVFSSFFKFIGLFIKTDPDLVLINCYGGMKYSDSPRAIFEYIRSFDKYDNLKIVWAFNNISDYSYLKGCSFVKQDSLNYFFTALKAHYWITNVNIERGLHFKRKDTIYLNTWHGIPFKTAGRSAGRDDYDCGNVNFWCTEGLYSEDIYIKDYRVRPEALLKVGIPRDDRLYHVRESDVIDLKKKMGLPLDKKIISYMPTWRESENGGKTYNLRSPIDEKKWEEKLSDEYIMLFRTHHFTTQVENVYANNFFRDATSYPDINDLYIVSDILISDYSSVITDFSILERPVICFGYDYDEYVRKRGLSVNLEEVIPNGVFRNEDDVLSYIIGMDYKVECEKTKNMIKRHFQTYGEGKATESCVKALFG